MCDGLTGDVSLPTDAFSLLSKTNYLAANWSQLFQKQVHRSEGSVNKTSLKELPVPQKKNNFKCSFVGFPLLMIRNILRH